MGAALNTQVPNPFFGLVQTGALSQPTVRQGQLLLPFPQYTGVSESGGYLGNATYHSLQMKVEKRFAQGGTVLAAYTFSKLMADVGTLTSWLDTRRGRAAALQDPNNLQCRESRSPASTPASVLLSLCSRPSVRQKQEAPAYDQSSVRQTDFGLERRAVRALSRRAFLSRLLPLRTSRDSTSDLRPNGRPRRMSKDRERPCPIEADPLVQCGLFSVPNAYTLGNESRTDLDIRGPGVNNFNFALLKRTSITERFRLEFRTEAFNLFNRVQFAIPNTSVTTAANPTTGYITSTEPAQADSVGPEANVLKIKKGRLPKQPALFNLIRLQKVYSSVPATGSAGPSATTQPRLPG